MQRLFGLSATSSSHKDESITRKALPASWYTSPKMFELERRAIFSRKWVLVSHRLRFANAGDYIQTQIGGYPIIVVKDRQGNIHAHHNVCRHRAYPLVQGDAGNVSIIACKYHNWSYSLDGKLAKAPNYQNVEGFDKTANSLFSVHVHVDKLGFVWINVDGKPSPEIRWEDEWADVDVQPRLESFDANDFHFDHQYEIIGDFNWKTLADNYNECYHCPTGHPALNSTSDFTKYFVKPEKGIIEHWNTEKDDGIGLGIVTTFVYPGEHFTVTPAFFYVGRWIPLSAGQTRMEYEVYKSNDPAQEPAFQRLNDIFKVVLDEDKGLCNAAYRNVRSGIFNAGELHPQMEKGPRHFQQVTREIVMEHHRREQDAKQQIWPARPMNVKDKQSLTDDAFCRGLESEKSSLSW